MSEDAASRVPELKCLERISPSRFESMRECSLREIWTANRVRPALPISPFAALGEIIHGLFEQAIKNGGTLDLSHTWATLEAATTRIYEKDNLNKRLLPLSRTIRDFYVRKSQALKKAQALAKSSTGKHEVPGVGEFSGTEKWFETKDRLIGGKIDHILPSDTGQGVVIRDYKTGKLTDHAGNIKPEYVTQLKMYAALYFETSGDWPERLELMDLRGTALSVEFSPEECERLLIAARNSLFEVNERISNLEEAPAFAQPGEHCRNCGYRPYCEEYRSNLDSTIGDVAGSLVKTYRFQNGHAGMKIRKEGEATIVIRDLIPDPEIHPEFEHLEPGQKIEVYGLWQDKRSPDCFQATMMTTIYIVEKTP